MACHELRRPAVPLGRQRVGAGRIGVAERHQAERLGRTDAGAAIAASEATLGQRAAGALVEGDGGPGARAGEQGHHDGQAGPGEEPFTWSCRIASLPAARPGGRR